MLDGINNAVLTQRGRLAEQCTAHCYDSFEVPASQKDSGQDSTVADSQPAGKSPSRIPKEKLKKQL